MGGSARRRPAPTPRHRTDHDPDIVQAQQGYGNAAAAVAARENAVNEREVLLDNQLSGISDEEADAEWAAAERARPAAVPPADPQPGSRTTVEDNSSIRMEDVRRPTTGRLAAERARFELAPDEASVQYQATAGQGANQARATATGSINPGERELALGVQAGGGPTEENEPRTNAQVRARGTRDLDGFGGGSLRLGGSPRPSSRGSQPSSRRERVTIHSEMGYNADIESPEGPIDDEGHYLVRGELTWTGELGAGAQDGDLDASISIRRGQRRQFTRRFDSREQATRWRDDAQRYFNLMAWTAFDDVDNAQEAAQLAPGESRSVRDDTAVQAGVGVTLEGVRVGVSATMSQSMEVVVTGRSNHEVQVQFRLRTGVQLGVNAGFGGATAGATAAETELAGATAVYDVAHGENSDGWRALDRVLNAQQMPTSNGGPGWRVTERSTGSESTRGGSASFAGASSTSSRTVREERVTAFDEEGNGTSFDRMGGELDSAFTSGLPTWLVDGTVLDDSRERYGFESANRDGGNGARLTAQVDGAGAAESHRLLAAATGSHTHTGVSGNDSGQWNLSASMTENQLRAFCRAVYRGEWNPGLVGAAYVDEAEELRERIRSAGGLDDCRRAASWYVAATGARGFEQMRQVLGDDAMTWDVALEDSNVWQGQAGRTRVEQQITNLRRQLEAGDDIAGTREAIEEAWRNQASRLNAMRDTSRFQELPEELRQTQVARNQALLDELDALRAEARDTVREARSAAAPEASPETSRLRGGLDHDAQRLERKYRETLAMYQAVAHERDIQQGRERDSRATFIADEDGDTDRSGDVTRRLHMSTADRHEQAGNHWRAGRRAWTQGDALKHQFEAGRAVLPEAGGAEAEIQALRRLTWQAHDTYDDALMEFLHQADLYGEIRAAYRARGQHEAYFGNTTFVLPS